MILHEYSRERLTPREKEILSLLARGLANKEIAARLFISNHTVRNHVHHILEKLQVGNRAGAVAVGFERGWLKAA